MMFRDSLDNFRRFYAGRWYPIFVALLCFIGHVTSRELILGGILVFSTILGFFLCRDIRFAIMPLLCCVFMVSSKGYSPATGYERYLDGKYIFWLAIAVAILFISITFFVIHNWRCRNQIRLSGNLVGLLVLSFGVIMNGAFHSGYSIKNLAFAGVFVLTTLGIFLLFSAFLDCNETITDHFIYCLVVSGLLIVCELVAAFFTTVQFVDGTILKESVILGWGVWTHIGGMLVFLMPACFYFALSHRHGWVCYFFGMIEFFCIILTQSRGALLVGCFILAVCLAVLCIWGRNRKVNRRLTIFFGVCGVLLVIVAFPKMISLIKNFLNDGMNDNGRFDLWLTGMKHFFDKPFFGTGFYDSYVNEEWNTMGIAPYLYHNTFVQMLGACGIVGFLCYIFHRVWTIRMVVQKTNFVKIFLGICILGLLLFNLIDDLFFKLYPTIFYSLMLLIMEYSEVSWENPEILY